MNELVAGKYRLKLLLGSGGMAEVWSATNTFTEREVAIKFLSHRVAKTPEATTRFLKEAKVSARIDHPNIIDVIDVGQSDEGQLFIVMELLTGESLETALKRETPPMSLHELAIVMIDVGEALAAAHEAGIVHRDLKPTNVFLHVPKATAKTGSGRPMTKLLDFGVSKFLEDDGDHAVTVAGTVLGSPLYMSPEQARGEANIDGRTDIFAFGSILFEALAGCRPYDARNFNALIVKIATSTPKSIDVHAPSAPESIRRIVRACMDPNLEGRARDFVEVTAMLRQALPELEALATNVATQPIRSPVVDPDPPKPASGARASRPAGASRSESSPGRSDRESVLPTQTPGTLNATATSSVSAKPVRSRARLLVLGAFVIALGLGVGALMALRPTIDVPSFVRRATAVTPPTASSANDVAVKLPDVPTAAPTASSSGAKTKILRIEELPSAKKRVERSSPRGVTPRATKEPACDGSPSCAD